MNRTATDGSAALAGIWTAFGAVPFAAWKDSGNVEASALNMSVILLFVAVFFFVPSFMFVIGQDQGTGNRLWFLDPALRTKRLAMMRRMFCWFVSAGAFGTIWSLILNRFILPLIVHA